MSGINFEALGRCVHLKKQIELAIMKRDQAFDELSVSYQKTEEHSVSERVKFADMDRMRGAFDELDNANTELTSLVDEYNRWADKGGKREIKFIDC
ncbi:hypothetical protein JYL57_001483 [Salmonella enterica subsp. enterica serovar Typhimurium]|uniref:hypothetical protein n=1 Tax=Salmonella enterica TaxID=28901 RepID=UPI00193D291D|nr:hypothetical protein [Salmonella enterica]EDY1994243.1 hypothetical protein [Salmonella enterica subsp. diarizonae]EEN5590429.1 hypothetical protein [Salmonella enterica subsp. enterica serovar Mountpleasant]EHD9479274.1 hypothetical protein [Salmonella enterica subsp. enterica serovar Typhimurium]